MRGKNLALYVGGAGAGRKLGAVATVYLIHAAIAVAFAWPMVKLLADRTLSHARGDLLLFEPGAWYLTEALRLGQVPLTSAGQGLSFGAFLALYFGLLPLSGLIHAVGRKERTSLPELTAVAVRSFGPLSALLGMWILISVFAGMIPFSIGSLLATQLRSAFGDRGSDVAEAGFRLLALGIVAGVGIVHDLARTAAVLENVPAVRAALLGAAALRAHPTAVVAGWALRTLSSVLLVALAARATAQIGIETAARFAVVTMLHQGVAFALVFLRADWLALAHELMDQTKER